MSLVVERDRERSSAGHSLEELISRVRRLENELSRGFIGREEEARVAVLALLTKQHAVFIGEPGTAKSALIRRLSGLVKAKFFYYMLNKYTVPDELIGPIDPIAYRNGKFVRNTRGKLPDAELAFIDEIFKGSSETLNALLSIMNERIFVDVDGTVYRAPLWSLYGASNETPQEPELAAFYDRFLLKHFVKRIDSSKLESAIIQNINSINTTTVAPVMTLDDVKRVYDAVTDFMVRNATAIAKVVSVLVVSLRESGIFVSDRTAVSPDHLPRLVATYSLIYGVDLKKAALRVSKYILQSEDMLEQYKNALDKFLPAELREAQERLDKARLLAAEGNLVDAKKLTLEALQIANSLLSKPDKAQLHKDELERICSAAESLLKKITKELERMGERFRGAEESEEA